MASPALKLALAVSPEASTTEAPQPGAAAWGIAKLLVYKVATHPLLRYQRVMQASPDAPDEGVLEAVREDPLRTLAVGTAVDIPRMVLREALKHNEAPIAAALADSVGGTLATVLSGSALWGAYVLIMSPFDTVLLQHAASVAPKDEGYYQTASRIGFRNLYRGLLASVVGILVYANGTRVLSGALTARNVPAAAGIAATVAGLAAYPLDTIRVRAVTEGVGSVQAARDIADEHGVAGFYRGFVAALGGRVVGLAAMGAVDVLRHMLS